MAHHQTLLLALAAATLAAAGPARAQGASDNRLREALRSTTSQLRALEAERAGWQAKQASLEARVAELEAEVVRARRTAARTTGKAGEISRLEEANQELTASLALCEEARKAASESAAAADGSRSAAAARAKELEERLAAAEQRSARLLAAGRQFVARLGKVGSDPIFGLRGVRLENLAQDYEDALLAERVDR